MEKTILLHCLSVEELKELIQEAVRKELSGRTNPKIPEDPELLLTRQETAELLRISLTSLWKWTDKGKLKSYGLGNRRYYKRSEVLESLTAF